MYAQVVTSQVLPGKTDEAVKIFQAATPGGLKQAKGYKGGWLLVDRKMNKGITVSLWETEADANAYQTKTLLDKSCLTSWQQCWRAHPAWKLWRSPSKYRVVPSRLG